MTRMNVLKFMLFMYLFAHCTISSMQVEDVNSKKRKERNEVKEENKLRRKSLAELEDDLRDNNPKNHWNILRDDMGTRERKRVKYDEDDQPIKEPTKLTFEQYLKYHNLRHTSFKTIEEFKTDDNINGQPIADDIENDNTQNDDTDDDDMNGFDDNEDYWDEITNGPSRKNNLRYRNFFDECKFTSNQKCDEIYVAEYWNDDKTQRAAKGFCVAFRKPLEEYGYNKGFKVQQCPTALFEENIQVVHNPWQYGEYESGSILNLGIAIRLILKVLNINISDLDYILNVMGYEKIDTKDEYSDYVKKQN